MATLRILSATLALILAVSASAQPPAPVELPAEPARLAEAIEKAAGRYEIVRAEGAKPLAPVTVMRWRNVVRNETAEALLVVWPDAGRPAAMASVYPWAGKMVHEFDSLARDANLSARDKDATVWKPATPGVEFKPVPGAPKPAATPPERLSQMKAMAETFRARMTGWQADDSDQEALRLLPRPLFRYDPKLADPKATWLDGALFAYASGTDPEVVLLLEAVGGSGAAWEYAFVRATSGGLEVRHGTEVVWRAEKHPEGNVPTKPHYSLGRPLGK